MSLSVFFLDRAKLEGGTACGTVLSSASNWCGPFVAFLFALLI
jgi:hypothetical protein